MKDIHAICPGATIHREAGAIVISGVDSFHRVFELRLLEEEARAMCYSANWLIGGSFTSDGVRLGDANNDAADGG